MLPTVNSRNECSYGTSVPPETQDKVFFTQTRTQFGMNMRIASTSREWVEQKRDKVLRNYPPAGYSTYFGSIKEEDSLYICHGKRFLSCD